MGTKINIGIAEDHDILRQTMSKLLVEEKNVKNVYEASNGAELLKSMEKYSLDIIILDLHMPIMDGRETLIKLQALDEDFRPGIIILSMHDSPDHVKKYIGLGAHAFLSKGCEYSELLLAIHNVLENGFHFTKTVTRELVSEVIKESNVRAKIVIDNPLSDREIQILRLICKQKRSVEISSLLGISLRTVENHRLHIMKKIGAKNSVGLLIYAMKNGLLDIEQL